MLGHQEIKPRFIVVGTVRNVARIIKPNLQKIVDVISQIGDLQVFLVESDSEDKTLETLQRIKEENLNFDYTSLGNQKSSIPDRIERLIFCRNVYVQAIREAHKEYPIDFVVVVDLDVSNNKLTIQKIMEALEHRESWTGIFPNQTGRYYDLAALRHPIWAPNSIFQEYAWYRNHVSPRKARKVTIYNRMIHLKSENSLLEVDSAFGGFAIYKLEAFLEQDYSRKEGSDSKEDIDHVVFNRRIRESGGKLFIKLDLMNTSWTRHSIGSIVFFRVMFSVIYRLSQWTKFKSLN